MGGGDLRIPPAAAHRGQQLDRVAIALRAGADIAQPRLLVLALSVEQVENAGAAAGIANALQPHRFGGEVEGALLGGQELGIVIQRLENVRHLAERLEHGLPVIGGRCLEGGKRRLPLGLAHPAVEDRLGEPRRQAPDEPGRVEEVTRVESRHAGAGGERDRRVDLRGRDADLSACGVKLSLRCQDVRTLVQEFRGQAHRKLGRQCQCREVDLRRRPAARRTAQQDGQRMLRHARLLHRAGTQRLVGGKLAFGTDHVRVRLRPGLTLRAHERQVLAVDIENVVDRPELGCGLGQIDRLERRVAGQAHIGGVQQVLLIVGLRRPFLDLPARAAEQVERIAGAGADLENVEVRRQRELRWTEPERCRAELFPRNAGIEIHLRIKRCGGGRDGLARGRKPRPGAFERGAAGDRVFHQPVDPGRMKQRPPVRRHLFSESDGRRRRRGAVCRFFGRQVMVGRRGLGRGEIRTDGAAGARRQKGRQKEPVGVTHGSGVSIPARRHGRHPRGRMTVC
nr:hypothetical protein [Aliidongia dinghuensis]